ncbi:MAG: ribosome maturation factor RimM [Rickettsiales bacterium]|jgi:16S rRNA processing protein RimM|nr:ribosome maturation factor RimM [Rickettsiales bacterium]
MLLIAMENQTKLLVGKIAAPHGLRGEARVQAFTESPADFSRLATTPVAVKFVRAAGAGAAICQVAGAASREDIEKLRGTELFVDRSDLPKLKSGEHYIADLIGMDCGGSKVAYVHNFGAGDILELGDGRMAPFAGAKIDYEKREIRLEK